MTDLDPTAEAAPDGANRSVLAMRATIRAQSLAVALDPRDLEEVAQIQREMRELLPEDSAFADT